MMVNVGHLKVSDKTICFCFTNQHEYQHLSLLKNNVNPYETLIKEWKIDDILAFQVKKFMLKQNAVEIFFKNRKSIFISFYGKEE
jgi:predicted secreted hydrolase